MEKTDLKTTHEEADVIIVQQIVHLALKGAQSIQVISDDTDVFVLLLHFFALEKLTCRIFMVGSSHGKSSVDITATAKNHSEFISELLAGHALSGCDTVACLFGIGKGTISKSSREATT